MRRRRGQETIESRLRRLERWLGVPGRSSDAWNEIARDDGPGGKVVAGSVYDQIEGYGEAIPGLSFFMPDGTHLLSITATDAPRAGDAVCITTAQGCVRGVVEIVTRHYSLLPFGHISVTVLLEAGSIQINALQPHEVEWLARMAVEEQERGSE